MYAFVLVFIIIIIMIHKLKIAAKFTFGQHAIQYKLNNLYKISNQKNNNQQPSKQPEALVDDDAYMDIYLDNAMSPEGKKQLDLDLSIFYKEILEKQRLRMDSNQRRVQDMLQREKQRADRKQQQVRDQLKQFLISLRALIGIGGVLGIIYYFFTVVNEGGQAFQKLKTYRQEMFSQTQIINQYSAVYQTLPKFYLQNNSIEKQLMKLQFDDILGLTYIVGIPGSGKTTALKKVVNELRYKIKQGKQIKWKKIYYISLRVDDENGKVLLQKTRQRIQQMSKLLKSIFSTKQNYENCLIIIDDIQMLQKVLTQNQSRQKLQTILFKCQMQSSKFVVVSSSSLSCYRALSNVNFKKSAYIKQLQNMNALQLKQAADKRIQHQRQTNKIQINQNIVKQIEKYDSIRGVMQAINLISNQFKINKNDIKNIEFQGEMMKILKQYDSNKIWDMRIQITKLLRQKSELLGKSQVAEILKCILKLPQPIKIGHKFEVINQVVTKFPKLKNKIDIISNTIDQLDQKNILIFAHPRSRLQRIALQYVLSGLEYQPKAW